MSLNDILSIKVPSFSISFSFGRIFFKVVPSITVSRRGVANYLPNRQATLATEAYNITRSLVHLIPWYPPRLWVSHRLYLGFVCHYCIFCIINCFCVNKFIDTDIDFFNNKLVDSIAFFVHSKKWLEGSCIKHCFLALWGDTEVSMTRGQIDPDPHNYFFQIFFFASSFEELRYCCLADIHYFFWVTLVKTLNLLGSQGRLDRKGPSRLKQSLNVRLELSCIHAYINDVHFLDVDGVEHRMWPCGHPIIHGNKHHVLVHDNPIIVWTIERVYFLIFSAVSSSEVLQ